MKNKNLNLLQVGLFLGLAGMLLSVFVSCNTASRDQSYFTNEKSDSELILPEDPNSVVEGTQVGNISTDTEEKTIQPSEPDGAPKSDKAVPTIELTSIGNNEAKEESADLDYSKQGSPESNEQRVRSNAPRGAVPKKKSKRVVGNSNSRRHHFTEGDVLARISSSEELWIIEKSRTEDRPVRIPDRDHPGCGSLVTRVNQVQVPIPLEHTDVSAQVSGYVASVDVVQKFKNPYSSKIEAVYVFPLPQNAAVNEFLMKVGDRTIRGIIREREQAKRIYQQAKRQGYVASLLTQERPNIFTQKVANIEPGKAIDITIKYFNTLAYNEGWYEFVFPMVVNPRFNPPGTTDGIGAVARNRQGSSGQSTEIAYLRPHERNGHDISLRLQLDAGVKIEDLRSHSHAVEVKRHGENKADIKLAANDRLPNKDFVLRYKVAGKQIKSNFITHEDENGGFFSLMIYPPADLKNVERQPVEMVFVLDCSGSMRGKPLAKAKQAMARSIRKLRPTDSFQVIRFSVTASQLGPKPLAATPENIEKGLRYLESLQSTGGTMMIEGIKASLDFPKDEEKLRIVSFMTDGHIGNERQIFTEIHKRLNGARIFSFGIGSSVNRYLLEGMARLGKGAVAYVGLDEGAGSAVDLFYERVRHPALTDIAIDWKTSEIENVYPKHIPDLFVGRPVLLTGRYKKGQAPKNITVSGIVGGQRKELNVAVAGDSKSEHRGIASIWARTRIKDLNDQISREGDKGASKEILTTALNFNLMSKFTAFVAVDSSRKTEGEYGTTVNVPVPVPDGVRYDTTVGQ